MPGSQLLQPLKHRRDSSCFFGRAPGSWRSSGKEAGLLSMSLQWLRLGRSQCPGVTPLLLRGHASPAPYLSCLFKWTIDISKIFRNYCIFYVMTKNKICFGSCCYFFLKGDSLVRKVLSLCHRRCQALGARGAS